MAIADGRAPNPLKQLAAGARCTWFLPSASPPAARKRWIAGLLNPVGAVTVDSGRSEEHTSELQSLMRISYDVFCLKKKHKHVTATREHQPRNVLTLNSHQY